MKYTAEGKFEMKSEDRQIHLKLFVRTLEISIIVVLAGLIFRLSHSFLTGKSSNPHC